MTIWLKLGRLVALVDLQTLTKNGASTVTKMVNISKL